MLKIRSYLIIALCVYLLTILVQLPAVLVVKPFEENLRTVIEVQDVSGSVWNGRVSGVVENQNVVLNWDWHLLQLFLLRLATEVHLQSSLVEAKSYLQLSPSSIKLEHLSGLVKSRQLNELLKKNGLNAQIENDIYLQNLKVTRSDGKFTEADGQVTWNGGVLRAKDLPDGKAVFPALEANLENNPEGLLVNLSEQEDQKEMLLSVSLNHQGQGHLRLKERVSKYVEVPKQLLRGNPDNVMFEIKRQIFDTQGKF